MSNEEFDRMVAALEARYQDKHPSLARRTAGLALLGYTGLAFFLLSGAVLAALCVLWVVNAPSWLSIKIGLVLGIPSLLVTWAIIRGLWVKLEAPEGMPVKRQDAPGLFEMIDEISREAGGVKFDVVLLTGDLNAAVSQVPRLGVFGWYKTYLLIGIPLIDSTSPEEFKAILAHEFAHLSHQHGRLGSWLYRLRASWSKVMDSLAEGGAPRPVLAFINWFWPRFNASAFVLSRSQEYQADAFAAKVTSPGDIATALQRIVVNARNLDDVFWSDITRETASRPAPPEDVIHRMHAFLGNPSDHLLTRRWLSGALACKTNTQDTHPGLTDRLGALGVPASTEVFPPLPARRASDAFLDPAIAATARDHFSLRWHHGVGDYWQESHREKQLWKERLALITSTSPAARWNRIMARVHLEGPAKLQDEIWDYLVDHPDHIMANYARGRSLADNDDPAAISYLEKASARPSLFNDSLGTIAGLLDRLGRGDEIPALARRANARGAQIARAMQERTELLASDRLLPPKLPQQEKADLVAMLGARSEIQRAWIVKKHVVEFADWPAHVLLLAIEPSTSGKRAMEILSEAVECYPGESYVHGFLDIPDNTKVATMVCKVEGSELQLPGRDPAPGSNS